MGGDVEVQDAAPRMFDDEEAIQKFEVQRGHGKEIHGDDRLAMIGEESLPTLAGILAPPEALQISSYRSFGDLETEFLQFAVDLRCAPISIFSCEAVDESPQLLAHLGSTAARP